MEDGAEAPEPGASASPSKRPRVLWRGMLILHDGTQLPGATIATHMHPWAHLHTDQARAGALEAEAELCLALEMVRHHALCVRPPHEDTNDSETLEASGSIQLCVGTTDPGTSTRRIHSPCPTLNACSVYPRAES